jgi:hypothetical protein
LLAIFALSQNFGVDDLCAVTIDWFFLGISDDGSYST